MPRKNLTPAADLHNHLGASVHPSILWSIAHRQGIKLPTKNYWEFDDMITMTGEEKNSGLAEMNERFFHWTELIQSSPEAVEQSVKAVIEGGFRKGNIVLHELRFNPMKRNRGGERDLDHIILAALWGKDKALLEYPQVKAGIILMMDRSFEPEKNEVILRKAIKYKDRGIIGLDIGGPNSKTFSWKAHRKFFKQAREAGLGITIHTGEEDQLDDMREVVRTIAPERIGHGVQCAKDKRLMRTLADKGIVLEVCPTSNLRNNVFPDIASLKDAFRAFVSHGVKHAICTDGPEMYQTHVYQEKAFLVEQGVLTPAEVVRAEKTAFRASFLD